MKLETTRESCNRAVARLIDAGQVKGFVHFHGLLAQTNFGAGDLVERKAVHLFPGLEIDPHPLVRVGSLVNVVDGPFSGAAGRLIEGVGRRSQLLVEVEFLGRAVAVPILPEQVQPVL